MRADIAKWAIANGSQAAAKKYEIPKSTICGFIKSHKEGQFGDGNVLESIPRKRRGGYKLLPEEIDEKVITLVKEMQFSGAATSYNIVYWYSKVIALFLKKIVERTNFQ